MLYEIDGKPAFRIDLYDNTVAHKWKNLIESIYVGDGEDIDHKRTFLHLSTAEDIKKMLLKAIHHINNFLKKDFIKMPTEIDQMGQNFFNTLHIAFEKLAGEFDHPTKLFLVAPRIVQESIRDLNYCVHMLEHETNRDKSVLQIQWTKARENTQRIKLEKDEYNLTQFNRKKNEVYLAYNELGKDTTDLWRDGLSIDYKNSKNKHYIGADIIVSFTEKENIFEKNFLDWCDKNKFDPFDKENGLGLMPIGKITSFDAQYLTKDSKIDIIEGAK